LITLRAVRRWAIDHGVPRSRFLSAYRSSLELSIARLAQAIYRERLCPARLVDDRSLGTCLVLGQPSLIVVPIVPKCFVRLDVRVWPSCYRPDREPICWSGPCLREFSRLLENSAVSDRYEELADDFQNSLSNLVLNRLLGPRATTSRRALEPAYQGHHYYPFPGLRVGPSVDQVIACSHLNTRIVAVGLLEVSTLSFKSTVFSRLSDCFVAWTGTRRGSEKLAIPVHPWQLKISPVVAALVSAGGARLLSQRIRCMPLASQRTLRVQATGYDVKLSVHAALTSEHRLLFRLNCENAPTVSALVRRLVHAEGPREFDIQEDVASLSFGDVRLAPHLSAIVRAPIRLRGQEVAVPAIELWTGREVAMDFLRNANHGSVCRFFRNYCRTLLKGPAQFLLRFGLAFEPHLQNAIVVFQGGTPRKLILRDLDGTVMDRRYVAGLLAAHDLQLARDTWDHMPSPDVGEDRLVHSLFFGHIGVVIDFLTAKCGADEAELLEILAEEWRHLPQVLGLRGTAERRFDQLCEHLANGKKMLVARLERSQQMKFIRLPRHSAFPQGPLTTQIPKRP